MSFLSLSLYPPRTSVSYTPALLPPAIPSAIPTPEKLPSAPPVSVLSQVEMALSMYPKIVPVSSEVAAPPGFAPIASSLPDVQSQAYQTALIALPLLQSVNYLDLPELRNKSAKTAPWIQILKDGRFKKDPEAQLKAAIAIAPDNRINNLKLALIQHYYASGREKEAVELLGSMQSSNFYNPATAIPTPSPEELYKKGKALFSTNVDEAVRCFEEAAENGHLKALTKLETIALSVLETDSEKGVKLLKSAAEKGSGSAQWKLGNLYWKAECGQALDRGEAIGWFKKACQNKNAQALADWAQYGEGYKILLQAEKENDAKAWHELGKMFDPLEPYRIFGKHIEEALKAYENAAKQGHVESFYKLGRCYEKIELHQDFARSVHFYKLAAEKGHAIAMWRLSILCGEGRYRDDGSVIIPEDKETGLAWLRQAAEKGCKEALAALEQYEKRERFKNGDPEECYQHALRLCYCLYPKNLSTSSAENRAEAEPFFEKAAAKGHEKALEALYHAYRSVNSEIALRYVKKLAALEKPEWTYILAGYYFFGLGCPIDLVEARRLVVKAAQAGDRDAQDDYRNNLDLYELIEAASMGGVAACYRKGSAAACYQLAQYYDAHEPNVQKKCIHKSTPKSSREAIKWYLKAAELGHIQAAQRLVACYKEGFGVDKSMAQAAKWSAVVFQAK